MTDFCPNHIKDFINNIDYSGHSTFVVVSPGKHSYTGASEFKNVKAETEKVGNIKWEYYYPENYKDFSPENINVSVYLTGNFILPEHTERIKRETTEFLGRNFVYVNIMKIPKVKTQVCVSLQLSELEQTENRQFLACLVDSISKVRSSCLTL
jgi:hypothetical protein